MVLEISNFTNRSHLFDTYFLFLTIVNNLISANWRIAALEAIPFLLQNARNIGD